MNVGHLLCRELKGNQNSQNDVVLLCSFLYSLSGFLFACLKQVFQNGSDYIIKFSENHCMSERLKSQKNLNFCRVAVVLQLRFSPLPVLMIMFNSSLVTLTLLDLSLCGPNEGHLHDFWLGWILSEISVSFKGSNTEQIDIFRAWRCKSHSPLNLLWIPLLLSVLFLLHKQT